MRDNHELKREGDINFSLADRVDDPVKRCEYR